MRGLQVVVFLLVGATLVCGGIFRSRKQIDDFRSFLEESVDGQYSAPTNQKLAELQNDWERSGKFEGDIVLTPEQIEVFVDDYSGSRNALLNANKLWTNKIVYYSIGANQFNSQQVAAIEAGIKDLERVSCVRFSPRDTSTRNYILVQGGSGGCYSNVGMTGGSQVLNLAPNTPGSGCFRHGTIVHEFLHALGFYHMQSTHNRDEFVKIIWDKIQAGTEHNFNKYGNTTVTNFDVVYDYGSVLHYSLYGFSIDGSKTMEPLKQTNEDIGQRIGMSPGDIRKLNLLYKCPGFV